MEEEINEKERERKGGGSEKELANTIAEQPFELESDRIGITYRPLTRTDKKKKSRYSYRFIHCPVVSDGVWVARKTPVIGREGKGWRMGLTG